MGWGEGAVKGAWREHIAPLKISDSNSNATQFVNHSLLLVVHFQHFFSTWRRDLRHVAFFLGIDPLADRTGGILLTPPAWRHRSTELVLSRKLKAGLL